jgi:T-complex protein 1 subunit theta
VISTLYAAHSGPNASNIGISIEDVENPILDTVKEGILDSLSAKYWAIKLAVDAAVTVLKVDQIIMSKP